jgi:hypothetical protein
MTEKACPQEQKVIENLARGSLDPELAEHVAHCPVCREARLVHSWMREFREEFLKAGFPEKYLPDPEIIWARACSARTLDPAVLEKVLKPLRVYRIAAASAVFLIVVLLILSRSHPVGRLLSTISGWESLASAFNAVLDAAARPFAAALLPAALGLLGIVFFALVTGTKRVKA